MTGRCWRRLFRSFWRQQWLVLQHLAEEPLGGIEIALCGQQEINGISMLVDGSVQISPFAADLDIGLIDPDRAAMWSPKLAQPFLDRCIEPIPSG